MRYEDDQDLRLIYSDVGMFTRGRSGYHADPDAPGFPWLALVGLLLPIALVVAFVVCR